MEHCFCDCVSCASAPAILCRWIW